MTQPPPVALAQARGCTYTDDRLLTGVDIRILPVTARHSGEPARGSGDAPPSSQPRAAAARRKDGVDETSEWEKTFSRMK